MFDIIVVALLIAVATVYVVRRLLFKCTCCGEDSGCASSGRKDSTDACGCCSGKK